MTVSILKSQTWATFEADVARHAFEMKTWRAHMGRVKESERLGHVGDQKYIAYPRPDAHPLVTSAVNENDDADFMIKDDLPTSEQILAAKKQILFGIVTSAETTAKNMILPATKRRAYTFREADIRANDDKIVRDIQPGMFAKAAVALKIVGVIDLQAEAEKKRSSADTKFLADQAARAKAIAAINRSAAQMFSEIEDLTLENIDKWKMPDFSK